MDNDSRRYYRIHALMMLFSLPILFSSCDSYNFSQPQPVDKANIYEFPKEFIGQWFTEEEPESRFYLVTRKNVLFVTHDTGRIVQGAWPKLADSGDFLDPPNHVTSFRTINYDSLKRPIDTIDNFLFRGQYIHRIGSDRFLEKGYLYSIKQDTVIILENDTISIDLGQNAFLRQLNKKFYVLNIRTNILDDNWYNDWWQIMLLEKKEDQTINIWECTPKTEELACKFYERPSKSAIFYFDCQWTTADMLRLVKEGYFEVSSTNYIGSKKVSGRE